MEGFEGQLYLKQVDNRNFEVVKTLIFRGRHENFFVPEGFVTDLASVPKFLWWLFSPYGSYTMAAVLHDMLWRASKGLESPGPVKDPKDVDGLFRRSMRLSGTGFFTRWLMWGGVRWAAIISGRVGSMQRKDWMHLFLVTLLSLTPVLTIFLIVVLLKAVI